MIISDRTDVVLELKDAKKTTWRDEPESTWLIGLLEEVLELTLSLEGKHEHHPDFELAKIASIALNWLDYRNGDPDFTRFWLQEAGHLP